MKYAIYVDINYLCMYNNFWCQKVKEYYKQND